MLPNLLLGTRRLRRDVNAQAQQLENDKERLHRATEQLRHSAVSSVTSPLGLLSAAGIGFLVGRMGGRPSQPKQTTQHRRFDDIATLAINASRSIGLQILLPIAAGWLQSKFDHKDEENSASSASSAVNTNNAEAP